MLDNYDYDACYSVCKCPHCRGYRPRDSCMCPFYSDKQGEIDIIQSFCDFGWHGVKYTPAPKTYCKSNAAEE
jgi:hypothetical protein